MWIVNLVAVRLSTQTKSTFRFHQDRNEGDVAGQAVELGDHKLHLVLPKLQLPSRTDGDCACRIAGR
jgi:hypothetical protein